MDEVRVFPIIITKNKVSSEYPYFGMTVYADSKTNITQNGTGSGTVINQQEEPQISTVNSKTTDNTSSSDRKTHV